MFDYALSLVLAASKIITESVLGMGVSVPQTNHDAAAIALITIHCSMRSAFSKVLESGLWKEDNLISGHRRDVDDSREILTPLARDMKEL